MSDTVATAQLRAFVERVERIEAEIRDLNADKSEIYKELRGAGFDVKAVRKVVAKRKLDEAERDEQDHIFNLYWDALTGAPRVHVYEAEEFDPETGELNEPAAATETAGDYLRGPAAVVSGQIIQEGDAPRGTGRHDGVAPRLDTHPDDDFEPPAFLRKREAQPLRPNCQNPSNCAGYGTKTCHSCSVKAAGEVEAA